MFRFSPLLFAFVFPTKLWQPLLFLSQLGIQPFQGPGAWDEGEGSDSGGGGGGGGRLGGGGGAGSDIGGLLAVAIFY